MSEDVRDRIIKRLFALGLEPTELLHSFEDDDEARQYIEAIAANQSQDDDYAMYGSMEEVNAEDLVEGDVLLYPMGRQARIIAPPIVGGNNVKVRTPDGAARMARRSPVLIQRRKR